jgi:LuxR family transcriptional regulator, quorum-sensing system regulator BjaR1
MLSNVQLNFTFDTIDDIAHLTTPQQVGETFAGAVATMGFTSIGINGLPPPEVDADPVILTERTPNGFRDVYIHDRLYLFDHICARARIATEPFRYSEAHYGAVEAQAHARFMQVLASYGMSDGIVVPVGRSANIPACVWLAGENPELHDDAVQLIQLIALFAASKAHALAQPRQDDTPLLTTREREVLAWSAQGKSAWEIAQILGLAKRTVDEHTQTAARKLGAANKTQAVVLALLHHMIEP